jgi:hypothetical protein
LFLIVNIFLTKLNFFFKMHPLNSILRLLAI